MHSTSRVQYKGRERMESVNVSNFLAVGYGYGSGSGDGSGDGYGSGYGDGDGSGYGYGYADEKHRKMLLSQIGDKLDASRVITIENAELKREFIEAMGINRFFSQLKGEVIHQDTDGCGNPRSLIKLKVAGARNGYLLAVKVICPTTGRVYHLGVPQSVKTCQEAVASTFCMKPEEYNPERES